LKRWKDTENYRQSGPEGNYANLAKKTGKKPTGPKPISKMGEEDPKFTKAQGQGVKLNQLLRTKFGSGNIELEETKVVGDQIQQWFGIEDEAVKRSKKLNVSPTSEALLKGILADIKKMDLPSGYKPVIRQIQNTHSGRVVQGGGMFLILVKDVKEDDFEDSIPDSYKSLATQPKKDYDAVDHIYSRMNDDDFPENASKDKIKKYVYNQFTLDSKTNTYKLGSDDKKYAKDEIEQIINKIEDDSHYGEGQHP